MLFSPHSHADGPWHQPHNFSVPVSPQAARRTRQVALLTGITMLGEIVAGVGFGSMALLADGWHMGTHLAAFGIALLSYHYAARYAHDPRYTFGTAKINVLGGFASAVALAVTALFLAGESLLRLFEPQTIYYNEALLVATLGLAVNLLSAFWLQDASAHAHHQPHNAAEPHAHDHTLSAAYAHVLADALTSVLAIGALLAAQAFGWDWLDPVIGLVGAAIIARWAYSLIQTTLPLLLDSAVPEELLVTVRQTLEQDSETEVTDLHIWQIGAQRLAALTLISHNPRPPESYKQQLIPLGLRHITVEVHHCHAGKPPPLV